MYERFTVRENTGIVHYITKGTHATTVCEMYPEYHRYWWSTELHDTGPDALVTCLGCIAYATFAKRP